jgi:hypothetical protein
MALNAYQCQAEKLKENIAEMANVALTSGEEMVTVNKTKSPNIVIFKDSSNDIFFVKADPFWFDCGSKYPKRFTEPLDEAASGLKTQILAALMKEGN